LCSRSRHRDTLRLRTERLPQRALKYASTHSLGSRAQGEGGRAGHRKEVRRCAAAARHAPWSCRSWRLSPFELNRPDYLL
jgi:hypothetical protein